MSVDMLLEIGVLTYQVDREAPDLFDLKKLVEEDDHEDIKAVLIEIPQRPQ